MVNNIKNNTINEIDAKKDLNTLNKIKNVETIEYKKRISRHKKLLILFNDLLDIILTDKTLEWESQEDENENEKVESRKEENEDDDYRNEDQNEADHETMNQNKKKQRNNKTKKWWFWWNN